MPSEQDNGDSDPAMEALLTDTDRRRSDEAEMMANAIQAARERVEKLNVKLEELQIQCLARGTRDVAEKAREAVKEAAEAAAHELERLD